MRKPTVSTATAAEIAEALLARDTKKLPSQACPVCRQEFIPVRSWQKFCSTKCRSVVANAKAKAEIDGIIRDLLEENHLLRERLKRYETGPSK